MSAFVTALGWLGAVTCLVAYVLVTRGTWAPSSGRYQLANVVSGALMGTVAAASGVWPSFVTNLVWGVVGLHAVVVALRRRARRRAEARDAVVTLPAAAPATLTPAVPVVVDLAA
ncbi:CBU_0592 family membrane protein [Cellulomonas iranensis]|uniref:CBU-0592-like domain-containing protein n=1 Tax=Cellulomonas iranensis TaxID=76862 RepID=A0ABU0GIR0_9CELL|nr:hypothetical protein [Cellulomonas iranensis]MDQ0425270.1 hypothetical protein [Cellulomonas iranensis]